MTTYIFTNSILEYTVRLDRKSGDSWPSLRKLARGQSSDVLDKLNGVFALVPECSSYVEPMAGMGISAGLVQQMFPVTMHLNDIDETFVKVLRERFPDATITHADASDPSYQEEVPDSEVVFIDFSHFTFRKPTEILEWGTRIAGRSLLYTDVFPFSIIPFDPDRLSEYIEESRKWLKERGLTMRAVYLYQNKKVMIVRVDRGTGRTKVRIVKAKDPFKLDKRDGLLEED